MRLGYPTLPYPTLPYPSLHPVLRSVFLVYTWHASCHACTGMLMSWHPVLGTGCLPCIEVPLLLG